MVKNNLIWIDLEMTGLDPDIDQIIEIATVITDKNLKILCEGPSLAIAQNKLVLNSMNEWNKDIHKKNGLLKLVKKSDVNLKKAELLTINFIKQWVLEKKSPMCGNSISTDKIFLRKYMPQLLSYFHYRSIDVSTIKELIKMWDIKNCHYTKKISCHRALDDIYESIKELVFYKKLFFKL